MSDPNNIVLRDQQIILMLPCKVGNTSIKAAFSDALGLDRKDLHEAYRWEIANKFEADMFGDGWFKIGFVRHPYARFMSAYMDKLVKKAQYYRVGLKALPTINYLSDLLPVIRDQHWRSMTSDLFIGRVMVPDCVYYADDLSGTWNMVQKDVADHCGLKLGEVPHLNKSRGHVSMTDHAKKRIADFYAADFENFWYEP